MSDNEIPAEPKAKRPTPSDPAVPLVDREERAAWAILLQDVAAGALDPKAFRVTDTPDDSVAYSQRRWRATEQAERVLAALAVLDEDDEGKCPVPCSPAMSADDWPPELRDEFDRVVAEYDKKGRGATGKANGMAKLTAAEVNEIRANERGLKQRELAKIFGVSESRISEIISGKSRTHELLTSGAGSSDAPDSGGEADRWESDPDLFAPPVGAVTPSSVDVSRVDEAAIRADESNKMESKVREVISGHIGLPYRSPPTTREEWGPRCAGCDGDEFRHDGYCSIGCRDSHAFAADVLAALSTEEES